MIVVQWTTPEISPLFDGQLEDQLGKPVHIAHGSDEPGLGWPAEHSYCGVISKPGARDRSPGPAAAVTCGTCIEVAHAGKCPTCGFPASFPL